MTQTTVVPTSHKCDICRKPTNNSSYYCSDACIKMAEKGTYHITWLGSVFCIISVFIFAIVTGALDKSEFHHQATIHVSELNSISVASVFFLIFFTLATTLIIWSIIMLNSEEGWDGVGVFLAALVFCIIAILGLVSYLNLFTSTTFL